MVSCQAFKFTLPSLKALGFILSGSYCWFPLILEAQFSFLRVDLFQFCSYSYVLAFWCRNCMSEVLGRPWEHEGPSSLPVPRHLCPAPSPMAAARWWIAWFLGLGEHRPVLYVENSCSFLDHPLWSPLFFSARVSESPKLPTPQLSETLTWLGFLLSIPRSRPGPVQKPVILLMEIIILCHVIHCKKKILSNIVSSFIIFNIRKATLLLPHEWKQKWSFWLEIYC